MKEEKSSHSFFRKYFLDDIRKLKLFVRIRQALLLLLRAFFLFVLGDFGGGRALSFLCISVWSLSFFFHLLFWALSFFTFFRFFGTQTWGFHRFFSRSSFWLLAFRSRKIFLITFCDLFWNSFGVISLNFALLIFFRRVAFL